MMPSAHRKSMLNFAWEFGVQQLIANGEVHPMFTLYTPSNERLVLPAAWQNARDKANVQAKVRIVAIAHDVHAISLITEAWTRSLSRANGETEAEFHTRTHAVRPSEAEDRTEVLMVTLTYRDDANETRSMQRSAEILRDAAGKPTGVKPVDDDLDDMTMTGSMLEILPNERPSSSQRAAAREVMRLLGIATERLR